MKARIMIPVLSVCLLAMFGASPSSAFEEIHPGIYRSNWKMIDDLPAIGDKADLDVLILEDSKTKSVSDAHMRTLRQWVESGGVLWVAGDGLESSLAQAVAPFQSRSFDFVRSSSGKRGGELIVKGLSPRMTIADHALTAGVNQLSRQPQAGLRLEQLRLGQVAGICAGARSSGAGQRPGEPADRPADLVRRLSMPWLRPLGWSKSLAL